MKRLTRVFIFRPKISSKKFVRPLPRPHQKSHPMIESKEKLLWESNSRYSHFAALPHKRLFNSPNSFLYKVCQKLASKPNLNSAGDPFSATLSCLGVLGIEYSYQKPSVFHINNQKALFKSLMSWQNDSFSIIFSILYPSGNGC